MNLEFAYFMKVNVAVILFYAFYRLFFYKDTFFKLRRTTLLAFFALALLHPLLNIQEWLKDQAPIADVIYLYNSVILPETTVKASNIAVDWGKVLCTCGLGMYAVGVFVLLIRFLVQLSSILWLAYSSPKVKIHDVDVRQLDNNAGPFSFFRWIFLCPDSLSEKETDEILTHERTHVSQWHSIDVMISELMVIFCWVNPFVWLLKREVRHNLEYLADNKVIQSGYDSKSYQYHLLGLAHSHRQSSDLYNSFNVLHLKNRISMMNKQRSHGINRTKYVMFIPLAGMLMLLSNIEMVARNFSLAEILDKRGMNESSPQLYSNMDALRLVSRMEELFPGLNEKKIPTVFPPFALATEKNENNVNNQVFTVVEEMPRFPGGDAALLQYIGKSIKYPVEAQASGIQGRVIVSFVVNKDGSICDAEVVRGIDPLLDREAMRVINAFPTWRPGHQRGRPVRVKYTVPITFRLS
ncbi:M56 family peptidase [Bacteroides sp. AM07-16]|uniref:M56 family metallopeptidase n=1 Tax=Parabacteroides bouchesdurhonensis TaxID=1936995 RepID=UPI000E509B9E|nr:M56 family metallopeptidase [Parabacteroides bouchesdurhonensis]RHJ92158.1 M56 family peptidase [Bacteroides sp. AM07-16]